MTAEYKPVVVLVQRGSVRAHIGPLSEIEVVATLDDLADALRTMHRSDATSAELLAALVGKLTTTEGAQA